MALTWEPDRAAFSARDRAVAALALGAADHVQLPAWPSTTRPSRARPCTTSSATCSRTARHRLRPRGHRAARGRRERAEAELIAAEVLAALRDGYAPEEIAVVVRAPDRSGPLLERVLAGYGIPFALQRRLPFGHTVIGRALCGLLRCALGSGDAADLLAWLRAPGLLDRPELADRLEARLRRAGATDLATARARFEDGAFPLDELDRTTEAAQAGPRPLVERIDRALGRLLAAPRRRGARVLDGAQRADAQAAAAARAALAELADPALDPVAPAELVDLLAELPVAVGERPRPGLVAITDPLAIRARRYRTVVVAGLQEGELPRLPDPRPVPRRRRCGRGSRRRAPAGAARRPRRRAPPVLRVRVAPDRAARARLPHRRRGGRTGHAVVLPRRRARALRGAHARRERPLAQVAWPPQDAPTEAERARARRPRSRRSSRPCSAASRARRPAPRWSSSPRCRPAAWSPTPAARCAGSWTTTCAHARSSPTPAPLRAREPGPPGAGLGLHRAARAAGLGPPDAGEPGRRAGGAGRRAGRARGRRRAGPRPDGARGAPARHGGRPAAHLEHEAASPTVLEPERFELGFGREEHDLPLVDSRRAA